MVRPIDGIAAAVVLAVLAAIPTASRAEVRIGELAWQRQDAHGTPPARRAAAAAYDTGRERVVLFGGYDGSRAIGETGSSLGDLWEWDGIRWHLIPFEHGPGPRQNHAMVTDPQGGVLLFGGQDGLSRYDDTWRWDGEVWTRIETWTSPPSRAGHGLAPTATGGILLVGGFGEDRKILTDSWLFDGAEWLLVDESHPVRGGHRMVQHAGVVLSLGGEAVAPDQTTLLWDGIGWSTGPRRGPSPRSWHGLAYDESRQRTVTFGGVMDRAAQDRGWEWDGATWQPLSTKPGPASRIGPSMVYDAARKEIVLFGGYVGGEYLNDTWTLGLRPLEPRVVDVDETLEVFLAATGGGTVEAAAPLPPGAELRNGQLRWRPATEHGGRHDIQLQARTSTAAGAATLVVEVETPPYLRLLGSRRLSVDTAELLTTQIVVDSNLPPEAIELVVIDLPEGATFDPGSGALTWKPTRAQAGTHRVRFEARSGELNAFGQSTIEVIHRTPPPEEVVQEVWAKGGIQGVRLGYHYVMSGADPVQREGDLASAHRFLMGYDAGYRFAGQGPLDLILLGGLGVTGLEQSAFRADISLGLHWEVQEQIRFGTAIRVPFQSTWESRLVLSVGWTATAGAFDLPVEIRFIPDHDGRHTAGLNVGVWW